MSNEDWWRLRVAWRKHEQRQRQAEEDDKLRWAMAKLKETCEDQCLELAEVIVVLSTRLAMGEAETYHWEIAAKLGLGERLGK